MVGVVVLKHHHNKHYIFCSVHGCCCRWFGVGIIIVLYLLILLFFAVTAVLSSFVGCFRTWIYNIIFVKNGYALLIVFMYFIVADIVYLCMLLLLNVIQYKCSSICLKTVVS